MPFVGVLARRIVIMAWCLGCLALFPARGADSTPLATDAGKAEGSQKLGLELIGTFDSLGHRRAMISIDGTDDELLVGEGDLVNGHTLESIGEGQMVLVRGDQREVVLMKDLRVLHADSTAKTYTQIYTGPNSFHPIVQTSTRASKPKLRRAPAPRQVAESAPKDTQVASSGLPVSSSARPRFASPIKTGNVSSPYGRRTRPWTRGGYGSTYHEGVDVAAPQGTRIYAAANGKVVDVSKYSRGPRGRYVTLRHSGGFETRYYHLYRVHVNLGDTVESGESIGLVGNTGRSSGPHLHFEIRQNGIPRNPAYYVRSLR